MARPKKHRGDDLLIAALASGATKESAARHAGMSLRTVHRRLDDADFCRELQAFRTDIVQRTAAALTAAGLEFVKTLIRLAGTGTPPATQLGAARAGLEIGMKVREQTDLEVRLAAMEERLDVEANQSPRNNSGRRR
jgi:hypothetical protein